MNIVVDADRIRGLVELIFGFFQLRCIYVKGLDDISKGIRDGWVTDLSVKISSKGCNQLNIALFEYWFPEDMIFNIFMNEGRVL